MPPSGTEGLGSQLQQGLVIDGHWRLLESEFCRRLMLPLPSRRAYFYADFVVTGRGFMRGFEWICPEWALRASESEDVGDGLGESPAGKGNVDHSLEH